MIWTAIAGAAVFALQQYHVMFRRLGAGYTWPLLLLDALVLLVGQIGLAIWLGIDLHWYALALLLVFIFGPLLFPLSVRAEPEVLIFFRWPVGILLVGAVTSLWLFSDHGLQLGRGAQSPTYGDTYSANSISAYEGNAIAGFPFAKGGAPPVAALPSNYLEGAAAPPAAQTNDARDAASNQSREFDRGALLNAIEASNRNVQEMMDATNISGVNMTY